MIIRLREADWVALHELMNAEGERAAFLYLRPVSEAADNWQVEECELLHDMSDYRVGDDSHLELKDDVRPRVILRAHDGEYAVAEVHGHYWPGDDTEFSRFDLKGLRDFAPHMLWRLPGRPYVSIVLGRESFDALSWTDRTQVETLTAINIDRKSMSPTGLSLRRFLEIRDGS
jgi:hypothetical protein